MVYFFQLKFPTFGSRKLNTSHFRRYMWLPLNYLSKREEKTIKLMRKTFKKLYGAKEAVRL
jgi:hypothetical protein